MQSKSIYFNFDKETCLLAFLLLPCGGEQIMG